MRFFDNLRLTTKLYLLVATLLSLGIGGQVAAVLELRHERLIARIDGLRAIVDIAKGMCLALQKEIEAGHLSQEEAIRRFTQQVRMLRYDGGTGYVFAYSMDGIAINLPNEKQIGSNMLDTLFNGRAVIREIRDAVRDSRDGTTVIRYDFPRPMATVASPKITYAVAFPAWHMFLGTGAYIDDLEAQFEHEIRGLAIGIAVVLLLVGAAIWLVARRITRPFAQLEVRMRELAAGDIDHEVAGTDRRDEVGRMAGAVAVFRQNAIEARDLHLKQAQAAAARAEEDERVRQQAQAQAAAEAADLVVGSIGKGLASLAEGDMTVHVDTKLPERYERLRTDLNSAVEEMRAVLGQIVSSSFSIRSGTDEITQAADDLARRTETQAASLQQTAATLGEITTTVARTASGAQTARDAAAKTREDADQSAHVVRQAVAAMGGIEQSSKQVGVFITVIDEIAFQTNLLALNAGVEAARAGDSGRGFAVVASEVRALAQRSAEAAREIKALIGDSAKQVADGVRLVGETGAALDRILSQVANITQVVSDIAASAQEQANGLREVNGTVAEMDTATQKNAAMVEQTAAAARVLAQHSQELSRMTERFRLGATGKTGLLQVA